MERLTKYDNSAKCYLPFSLTDWSEIKIMNKLGELEDVLEKCGIESVEELEDYLTPKLFCYAKLSENLDEFKKDYKCEPIIHIDPCEPQIEPITDKVKDLEQQLAELKQKAIVPKFSLGQTCFIIWENDIISARIEKIIMKLSKDEEENSIFYSITNQYGYALRFPEEQIFATKEEAEQRLKEIKGE